MIDAALGVPPSCENSGMVQPADLRLYEDEIRSVEGPGRDGGLTDAERHVALTEPLAT